MKRKISSDPKDYVFWIEEESEEVDETSIVMIEKKFWDSHHHIDDFATIEHSGILQRLEYADIINYTGADPESHWASDIKDIKILKQELENFGLVYVDMQKIWDTKDENWEECDC